MAFLSGWDKRIKLTVDASKIDADLTWFPITVFLTATQAEEIFTELTTDAEYLKVAFTKEDGETELYAEMEMFDVSELKGIFHVSRDGWVIDDTVNTDFYMYYDKDHTDNTTYIGAINTTAGAAVWDGNFKAVHHLVDATTSTVLDSTSNNNDGTKNGPGEPASAAGKVGLAQDFDGINDFIRIPDSATLDFAAGFTLEAIADPDGTDAYGRIMSRLDVTSNDGYFMGQYTTGAGIWFFQIEVNDVPSALVVSNSAPSGAFQHVVGVRDANGVLNVYVDGAVQTSTNTLSGAIDSIAPLYLGTFYDGISHPFAGIEDEVRISNTNRSAAWIKATYNSLFDTLFTYGDEELAPVLLEFNETLSIVDTMATSGTLAKAETLSIVDTWGALIAFYETLSIADSEEKLGELDLNETLSIMDTKVTSTSLFFQETLSIIDSVIKSITKQFSESLSITDSKLLTGSLELDETLGIVDSAVYQCIKTFYETLSIIDTKITSGSLEFDETLSIVDSWTVLKNFFETLSITDTISKTGSLNVSEIISIIDSFIRWIEHPIYTEPAKSSLSFTKPTKTNPVYTKPVKGTTSFTEPAKSNPVYTEPTKGHPVYIEPTKEIKLD